MVGIIALCQICSQKVKGSLRVSSNFVSHIRKQHPKAFQKFKLAKNENRGNKNKTNNFHVDLLNFICESCSPLSILDNASFKKMFPNKIIPCRRTITRLLNENHNVLVNNIVNELSNVQFVCLTADVWSGGKRSFFGVTCHWLDTQLLRRHSAALACRRFKGAHSFERVTELLLDVCRNHEIPVKKIVYTITDNGSNFIKAFKEFGISLTNFVGDDDEGESESSDADDDEENQPDFQTVTPYVYTTLATFSKRLERTYLKNN